MGEWTGGRLQQGQPNPRGVRCDRIRATVDELYTPYVFPQENGNRTDTSWVSLANTHGMGLVASGVPTFSAHRFTTEDLDRARHTTDLVPRDYITLNLDYQHNGIGTASCGPGPWERYRLKPEEFGFTVRLRPFSLRCSEAGALDDGSGL